MWSIIPSLDALLQALAVVFTEPSFQTHRDLFLGWIMCIGKRTEYRVFQTIHASSVVSRVEHHPFDRFYNFFSRSAWTVQSLAHQVAVAIVLALNPTGPLYLVVDDTLLHKRGQKVYGLGWFRDAVASTAKRVTTASGNNWVVMGLAIPIPLSPEQILCLPLSARLHLPGAANPSGVDLAAEMLAEVLRWFPDRQIVLIGDGGYAGHGLLGDLDRRVQYVGRMRGDAEIYDPQVPPQPAGKRGRKPQKGPRLPSPRGGEPGRPQARRPGALGVARHRGDRLWDDPNAPRLGVPGGVARSASAGVAPDPDRGGARPGGEVP